MKTNVVLLASAAALLSTSVVAMRRPEGAGDARPPAPPVAGNVAHGRQAFVAVGCYQCHGYAGQGAESTGPALVPQRLGEAGFVAYLRAPRGVMPAFSARLLPADTARDILAYIQSLRPGRPAARIPLLAHYVVAAPVASPAPVGVAAVTAAPMPAGHPPAADGARLFAANCAGCHGENLQGGMGPNLQGEGARRSAEQIAALIAAPPPGMPKLSPEPLSPAQALQVAAFVHGPH